MNGPGPWSPCLGFFLGVVSGTMSSNGTLGSNNGFNHACSIQWLEWETVKWLIWSSLVVRGKCCSHAEITLTLCWNKKFSTAPAYPGCCFSVICSSSLSTAAAAAVSVVQSVTTASRSLRCSRLIVFTTQVKLEHRDTINVMSLLQSNHQTAAALTTTIPVNIIFWEEAVVCRSGWSFIFTTIS